jgi:hypothetical protein
MLPDGGISLNLIPNTHVRRYHGHYGIDGLPRCVHVPYHYRRIIR